MRILVADDRAQVRSALHLLLDSEPGMTVIEDIADADELFERVRKTCPDLVLIDWELPGLESSSLISALRSICPHLSVIALSGIPEAREAALAAHVDAFVSKGDPPERLLETVHRCRYNNPR